MRTAIDLLTKDHQTVRKLLDRLVDTTTRATKTRQELLEQISTELEVHTAIEEEIFYPAIRDAAHDNEQRAMIAEALEEHRAAGELVLPDLEQTDVDSVQFSGRAKVLRELVLHHADEEEEELFPLAEELLGDERLSELGEQLAARKEELLSQLDAA